MGSATSFGMKKLGHRVIDHDIKLGTDIRTVSECDLVFICLPTPCNEDGTCDTKLVQSEARYILQRYRDPVVCIKSTIAPGTTENLIRDLRTTIPNPQERLCFVPEFLRERQNIGDFIENHKLLAVGTTVKFVYDLVVAAHGDYPKATMQLTPTQAELLKYFHNTINALRISLANEYYDLCESLQQEYTPVKRALLKTTGLPDQYMDVCPSIRSWSSVCFNKDIPALVSLAKSLRLELPLLYNLEASNNRHEKTPFAGTRESY